MCLQHPRATCQQSAGWPVGEEEVGGGLLTTLLLEEEGGAAQPPGWMRKQVQEVEGPVPSPTMTDRI